MSVTRNAPCPCGSGKKYKKCCLEKDLESSPTLRGQRFRAARDALLDGILEFLANNFPPDIADMAMDDFERGGVRDEEPGAANVEFFIPYMLFLWTNRHWDRKTRKRVSIDVPLAETYLKAYPRRPTELGRAYLEAALRTPYCFHEVVSCRPGEGLVLKDILTQDEVFVYDVGASRSAPPTCVLFGQVVKGDGTALLGAASSLAMPAGEKPRILQLRSKLREHYGRLPTAEELLSIQDVLLDLYWNLYEGIVRPEPPDIRNTDGDPIELHVLRYEIEDIESVAKKLAPLCVTESHREVLDGATRDEKGAITEVDITWDKLGNSKIASYENTILGSIHLEGRTMTVAINSAKRAKRIRRRIETLAGDLTRLVATEAKALDEMADGAFESVGRSARERREEAAFERQPEIQAMMADFHRRQMESWLDQEIPALGGRTPREAVKDPDGREMVDALLTDFEQKERAADIPGWNPDVYADLRESLGLT